MLNRILSLPFCLALIVWYADAVIISLVVSHPYSTPLDYVIVGLLTAIALFLSTSAYRGVSKPRPDRPGPAKLPRRNR